MAHVGGTRIFARREADGRQLLVYAMSLAAAEDLAMVLPLPVGPGGLKFLDLSGQPDFFTRLDAAFPSAVAAGRGGPPQPAPLPVERVGAFEASFVPGLADFARLDPRFRLDPAIWRQLGVADRSFAVFQLAGRSSWWRSPTREVHPMGLRFDTPGPGLFFPTLHVHDGAAHPTAAFDHTLYVQAAGRPFTWPPGFALRWQRGEAPALGELLALGVPVWRGVLAGELPNQDLLLPLGAVLDEALVERITRRQLGGEAEEALVLLRQMPGPSEEARAERALSALRLAPNLAALRVVLQSADERALLRVRGPRLAARFGPGVPYDAAEAQALARQDEQEWEAWLAR